MFPKKSEEKCIDFTKQSKIRLSFQKKKRKTGALPCKQKIVRKIKTTYRMALTINPHRKKKINNVFLRGKQPSAIFKFRAWEGGVGRFRKRKESSKLINILTK